MHGYWLRRPSYDIMFVFIQTGGGIKSQLWMGLQILHVPEEPRPGHVCLYNCHVGRKGSLTDSVSR